MKEMTTQVYSGPKWVISNVHLFGTKIPGPDPAPPPWSSVTRVSAVVMHGLDGQLLIL
jgi:hypothetical protein